MAELYTFAVILAILTVVTYLGERYYNWKDTKSVDNELNRHFDEANQLLNRR